MRGQIERAWRRIVTDAPFSAEFSEDVVAELYNAETARAHDLRGLRDPGGDRRRLGLFGLAAFIAERRTKEIGIRKVFGARIRDIVSLLAWHFAKPVIVANLIAWPAACYAMKDLSDRL